MLRALVVYGTRWGGTTDVALKIGDSLKAAAFTVDVSEAGCKPLDISKYSLVVVGSGIRADHWTKTTLRFLEKNADALRDRKTALFVSCQMADREEEARHKAQKKYLFDVAAKYGLTPIAFGLFGGVVNFKKSHGIVVDIIVRVNRKKLLARGLDIRKVYDTRDWGRIRVWASEVSKAVLEGCEKGS